MIKNNVKIEPPDEDLGILNGINYNIEAADFDSLLNIKPEVECEVSEEAKYCTLIMGQSGIKVEPPDKSPPRTEEEADDINVDDWKNKQADCKNFESIKSEFNDEITKEGGNIDTPIQTALCKEELDIKSEDIEVTHNYNFETIGIPYIGTTGVKSEKDLDNEQDYCLTTMGTTKESAYLHSGQSREEEVTVLYGLNQKGSDAHNKFIQQAHSVNIYINNKDFRQGNSSSRHKRENLRGSNFYDMGLVRKNALAGHQDTAKKPFVCSVCNMGFLIMHHLKSHESIHTHTREHTFVCNVCKKGFNLERDLKSHECNHTNEGPFICNVCKKGFNLERDLKSHERNHTNEGPFICNVCKKGFNLERDLKSHERSHTNERPFECNVCKKGFIQKGTLIKHERIHTGERPFVCNVCKKDFNQKRSLKVHERIHSVEKPFVCNVCKIGFNHKSNLTRHERIHTGERNFLCNVCKRVFNSKIRLILHEHNHTCLKPFVCNICKKGFNTKSNLTSHERTHHR